MYVACIRGDLEKVKLLIANCCEMHCFGDCLHVACGEHHLEVVKLLVANGADIHTKEDYGSTP